MGLRDYHSFTVPTTDFLPPVFLAPTDTMVFTKAALLLLAGLGTTFVSAGVNTVTLKAAFGDMKGQYKNREGNPTTYYLHENDKENDQKYILFNVSKYSFGTETCTGLLCDRGGSDIRYRCDGTPSTPGIATANWTPDDPKLSFIPGGKGHAVFHWGAPPSPKGSKRCAIPPPRSPDFFRAIPKVSATGCRRLNAEEILRRRQRRPTSAE